MWFRKSKRIYLDYAAATPVRQEVLLAMKPYWNSDFANPSAIHQEGQKARQAVEDSRQKIARLLGVRETGVVFTGSGTESNDLAIRGVVNQSQRPYSECEIITTRTQHPSVIETLNSLAKDGVKVHYCPVTEEGKVNKEAFTKLLSSKTVLVTLAYANSEIGVIEDLRKLSRLVVDFNQSTGTKVLMHVDAAQAPLWLACRLENLGADLLSLDAGKCYGPKGVGVLAFHNHVTLTPVLSGGGQEFGLRAGTENVAGIVGVATALKIAERDRKKRVEKVLALRNYLIEQLVAIEGVVLNGSQHDRLANNVNISVPGLDSEFLVVSLDTAGIATSTKSACGGMKSGGSYVVREITADAKRAESTIRLTLGEETTLKEVKQTAKIIKNLIKEQQNFVASLAK